MVVPVGAIKNGKCVDTSMGLTPLEGIVMGTRCGDIDPSIVFFLIDTLGYTVEDVRDTLNKNQVCWSVWQNQRFPRHH